MISRRSLSAPSVEGIHKSGHMVHYYCTLQVWPYEPRSDTYQCSFRRWKENSSRTALTAAPSEAELDRPTCANVRVGAYCLAGFEYRPGISSGGLSAHSRREILTEVRYKITNFWGGLFGLGTPAVARSGLSTGLQFGRKFGPEWQHRCAKIRI